MHTLLPVFIFIRAVFSGMVAYEARYRSLGAVPGFILAFLFNPLAALFIAWMTPFKPFPRKCSTCDHGTVNDHYCPKCHKDFFGHEAAYYGSEVYAGKLSAWRTKSLRRNKWLFYSFIFLEVALVVVMVWRLTRRED
jgi:hypothetical protein